MHKIDVRSRVGSKRYYRGIDRNLLRLICGICGKEYTDRGVPKHRRCPVCRKRGGEA